MYKKISAQELVEKYKIIPKPLRKLILKTCQDYEHYGDMYDLYWLDMVYNTYDTLLLYEAINDEDYDYLIQLLNNIYAGKCGVYYEVISDLLIKFKEISINITQDTIFKFKFNNVIKMIDYEVAYRPGKYGYEKVLESFTRVYKDLI